MSLVKPLGLCACYSSPGNLTQTLLEALSSRGSENETPYFPILLPSLGENYKDERAQMHTWDTPGERLTPGALSC